MTGKTGDPNEPTDKRPEDPMGLKLTVPVPAEDLRPKIVIFGVGGAGGNAVNNMIEAKLEGVECVVANTDAQALAQSLAQRKIQLGLNITQGLGAGSRPEIGRAAAEEGTDLIIDQLDGCHMAFVTAGMGGGTGTGAAPVIAKLAREQGVLTVGVVTKPFHFEGSHRMRVADSGLDELQDAVDTLIVIPNQNLFRIANEQTTFADAFQMADEVLYAGVRGVTDLMTMPGLINLDFADIRTVMAEMGKAMMGAGEAEGDSRAVKAAESAISNPLLDDVSLKGARGVLINITGGNDMTLYEVDEAANRIREEVDPDANIIFGSTFDGSIDGKVRVSIFATGITQAAAHGEEPAVRSSDASAPYTLNTQAAPAASPSDEDADRVVALSVAEEQTPAATVAPPVAEPQTPSAPEPEVAEVQPTSAQPEGSSFFETQRADEIEEPVDLPDLEEQSGHMGPIGHTQPAAPVREVTPEPASSDDDEPQKTKGKARSRLLGLLIDNSASEDRDAEQASGFDDPDPSPDIKTLDDEPAAPVTEPQSAAKPIEEPPSSEEREEAELLEIPAFLRRQAN